MLPIMLASSSGLKLPHKSDRAHKETHAEMSSVYNGAQLAGGCASQPVVGHTVGRPQ